MNQCHVIMAQRSWMVMIHRTRALYSPSKWLFDWMDLIWFHWGNVANSGGTWRCNVATPQHNPNRFPRDDPGETSACVCHQWFNDHWMHIKMQWQEKMPSSISSTLFQPMKAPCFVEFLGTPQMPPMDQESISECHRMLCSPHFWHFHYDFLRYDGAAAIHCTISGWREGHGKMWKQRVFDPWILATHCNFQAESRKKVTTAKLDSYKRGTARGYSWIL